VTLVRPLGQTAAALRHHVVVVVTAGGDHVRALLRAEGPLHFGGDGPILEEDDVRNVGPGNLQSSRFRWNGDTT